MLLPTSPMRLPLVALVIFAVAVPLSAQQPAAPKKTENAPKPKIVAPAPTPEPKRSMIGRIFGSKPKPTPAPAPAPAPTPAPAPVKPKPRPKPKAKPAAEATEPAEKKPEGEKPKTEAGKPAAEEPKAETPKPEEPAKPEAKAEGETPKPAEAEAPKAKSGKAGKGKNAAKTPPKPAEEVVLDDATKYKNARAKALEDEQVKELKGKADSAIAEDEAHRASVSYNKALFRKIRQLDPSLDAYVDKLEEAMTKRLSAEKREQ